MEKVFSVEFRLTPNGFKITKKLFDVYGETKKTWKMISSEGDNEKKNLNKDDVGKLKSSVVNDSDQMFCRVCFIDANEFEETKKKFIILARSRMNATIKHATDCLNHAV